MKGCIGIHFSINGEANGKERGIGNGHWDSMGFIEG